jgi:hypothetical protein
MMTGGGGRGGEYTLSKYKYVGDNGRRLLLFEVHEFRNED